MNKIRFFLIAAVLLCSSAAMAQKTGYVSVDQIIQIMPDAARIDSLMQKYQRDTINSEFQSLVEQYNYKDSIMRSPDTAKLPPSIRKQYRQDLEQISYQVQNWQSFAQQLYQNKQTQLLEPVYRRVMNAIQAIAKEKGYTYVYDKSVLVVAPPADDLLPMVAQRLNIKLPPQQSGTGLR